MILKQLRVVSGMIHEKTNCYIVQDEISKETMVIDPGGEADRIIEMLNILEAKLKYIYLTHCHGDHIGALKELKEKKGGKILIHRLDAEGIYNKAISLTEYIGIEEVHLEADSRVDDGDTIHIGNIEFEVIHTPGHTAGCSSLYCKEENLLFPVIHYFMEHGEEQIYQLVVFKILWILLPINYLFYQMKLLYTQDMVG